MKKKELNHNEGRLILSTSDKILAIIFGVIVCIMFVQVVFRYIFNSSLSWSEELVRYLFVWLVFWGGALALKDKMHIGVDFFIELFSEKHIKYIRIFDLVLITIFHISLVIIGLAWVYTIRGLLSSALRLPVNISLYTYFI